MLIQHVIIFPFAVGYLNGRIIIEYLKIACIKNWDTLIIEGEKGNLMKVECPGCNAVYKIDDNKIGKNVTQVTCPKCKNKIAIISDMSQVSEKTTPTTDKPHESNISIKNDHTDDNQNMQSQDSPKDSNGMENINKTINEFAQKLKSFDLTSFQKNRYSTPIIVILIVIAASIIYFSFNKSATISIWYNYGNGMINLSNVHNIIGEMSFTLKLKTKNQYGNNEEKKILDSDPITSNNIKKVKEAIKTNSGQWESVSSQAAIKFDSFTLRLPGFKESGIEVTDDGCVKLVDSWLKTYSNLVSLLNPYSP
jgi:predicted Zn finger-like uncharacterized protein